MITQLRMLRDRYGDIVKLDSVMNRRAYILLFSAELCEKMYRMESMWPMRISIESLQKQYDLATRSVQHVLREIKLLDKNLRFLYINVYIFLLIYLLSYSSQKIFIYNLWIIII